MKRDGIQSTLGMLAGIIVIAMMIAGGVFVYKYFTSFKKDIVDKDVKIEVLQEGEGSPARQGDTVEVNYKGTLLDGKEFDNSYKRGMPFPVTLGEGRVIKGWEVGLLGIKKGEKRRLTIPALMAYGARSIPDGHGGDLIPPNSTLVFEIEAIAVHNKGY